VDQLKKVWKRPSSSSSGDPHLLDEAICEAMAELALCLVRQNKMGDDGSMLCFLPGIDEMRLVERMIRQGLANKTKQQQQHMPQQKPAICFLHSSLSSKEQAKVFVPGPKIILSTNIAETSVTIPDVKIVIDSGRERQFSLLDASLTSETATVVGSQLATVPISQASAQQRAGRAGRVSAGTCYRLHSRAVFDHQFQPHALPEMQRMELSQLLLHSTSMCHPSSSSGQDQNNSNPLTLLLGAPDPPEPIKVRQTLYALKQQGLVTSNNSNSNSGGGAGADVQLTPLGRAVANVPASPRVARSILALALVPLARHWTLPPLWPCPKCFRPRFGMTTRPNTTRKSAVVMS